MQCRMVRFGFSLTGIIPFCRYSRFGQSITVNCWELLGWQYSAAVSATGLTLLAAACKYDVAKAQTATMFHVGGFPSDEGTGVIPVSYTHLTLPTNREV